MNSPEIISGRCEQCVFFNKVVPEGGECRFEPPKVFMMPVEDMRGRRIEPVSVFPSVRVDHWCGQFDDSQPDSESPQSN